MRFLGGVMSLDISSEAELKRESAVHSIALLSVIHRPIGHHSIIDRLPSVLEVPLK